MPEMIPRPTVYNGIPMRSRMEAAFAAWLDDQDGVKWEYEPYALAGPGGQYLPDFVITGIEVVGCSPPQWASPTLITEVKPPTFTDIDGMFARMSVANDTLPDGTVYCLIIKDKGVDGQAAVFISTRNNPLLYLCFTFVFTSLKPCTVGLAALAAGPWPDGYWQGPV